MASAGKQPLASVDSLLQDALALLATVQQPNMDALPKFQVKVIRSCEAQLQKVLLLNIEVTYSPPLPSTSLQECITLLSQAEHLLAAAFSLRTKLTKGLELRTAETKDTDRYKYTRSAVCSL